MTFWELFEASRMLLFLLYLRRIMQIEPGVEPLMVGFKFISSRFRLNRSSSLFHLWLILGSDDKKANRENVVTDSKFYVWKLT